MCCIFRVLVCSGECICQFYVDVVTSVVEEGSLKHENFVQLEIKLGCCH
jgi:hypothetical protein